MLNYHTKFKPATLGEINEIEKLLGQKLPADVAEFLRSDGGGYYVEPSLFHIPGEGSDNLKTLYGISDESHFDIRYAIRMTHTYPKGFLPIGVDFFGNRIVLGLKWLKKGKVFWCDHDLDSNGHEKKPVMIASDLASFLAKLRPSPDLS